MTRPPHAPTARPNSPPPPLGLHDLRVGPEAPVRVAFETNTCFRAEYRDPLAASAEAGDLAVCWSPSLQRELTKVAYRKHILAALRAMPPDSAPTALAAMVTRTVEAIATALDAQLTELERFFRFSPRAAIDDAILADVADSADRSVFHAALAGRASYLLTLDQRHLPHGTVFGGVQCWHPDTFLTLFYQQNPDAYVRVRRGITLLSDAITRRLLP